MMKLKTTSTKKGLVILLFLITIVVSSCFESINFNDKGKAEMEGCAEILQNNLADYLERYKSLKGSYPINTSLKMDRAMLASLGKLDCALILDRKTYSTEVDVRDYLSSENELISDSAFLVIGHPIHLIYYESLDGKSYRLGCFGWNGINEQGEGDDLLLVSPPR